MTPDTRRLLARARCEPIDELPKWLRVWWKEHSPCGCPEELLPVIDEMLRQQLSPAKIKRLLFDVELDALPKLKESDLGQTNSPSSDKARVKAIADKYCPPEAPQPPTHPRANLGGVRTDDVPVWDFFGSR